MNLGVTMLGLGSGLIVVNILAFLVIGLIPTISPWTFVRLGGILMEKCYGVLGLELPEERLTPFTRLCLRWRSLGEARDDEIREWDRIRPWARTVGIVMVVTTSAIILASVVLVAAE
jgi:hypothetical protein